MPVPTHTRVLALLGVLLASLLTLAPGGPATAPAHAAAPPGALYAWGGNVFGELGDGTTTPHRTPAPVSAPDGADADDVVDVHTGREHGVALRADGSVLTWGSNQMGQLGSGTTGGQRAVPAAGAGLSDVVQVSTGP